MTDWADQDLLALYVRLFFDEDVSASIVDNLRQRGFDVTSVRDTGRLRLNDASQLAFAAADGRAFVTHNHLDFERLHQRYLSEGLEHHGIIVAKRRPSDIAVVVKLLALLNEVTADDMINQLCYVLVPLSFRSYRAPSTCQ